MKKNKTLILSIIAVILTIILVSGGTYAYWSWSSNASNANERTNVSFNVSSNVDDLMYARLDGASTTISRLQPSPCTKEAAAIVKTVNIYWTNVTTKAATVTATLKVTAFKFRSATYKPTSTTLQSLKWAIRETAATTATTSSPNTCENSITTKGNFSGLTIPNSGTTVTTGLPLTLGSVSFTAAANTSTQQTKTYYLYIWLDYGYNHTNVGDVNSDPMQDLEFTVEWSGTMV